MMNAPPSRRSLKIDARKRRDDSSRLGEPTGLGPGRDPPAGFDTSNHLLTVAQAAACQISQRQIRRMIGAGDIPVLRFGRSIRIRPKDLGI